MQTIWLTVWKSCNQSIMETVEGLRTEQIMEEYAPTSLSTAEISYGGSTRPQHARRSQGNPLDAANEPYNPCKLSGHIGHKNSQCRVQWGDRAGKYKGRTTKPTSANKAPCRFYLAGQKCPFEPRCKFAHSKTPANAYLTDTSETTREDTEQETFATGQLATASTNPFSYIEDATDDESSGNE